MFSSQDAEQDQMDADPEVEEPKKGSKPSSRGVSTRGAPPTRGMSGLAPLPEGDLVEDILLDDEEAWVSPKEFIFLPTSCALFFVTKICFTFFV